MSQLFARVFLQILDSSIAEDFTTRHVFEDFLKLADYKTGIIDMTRQALSRRLNIPLDLLNDAILKLESPDPASRDSDHEGRRIERLDDHRDWGWIILNHAKYDEIRTKADAGMRVARHRSLSGVDDGTLKRASEIYAAYPRKVGKPDAMRAIVKALSTTDFDRLLTATQKYAEARKGEDDQFTPHPSTWFNQQRYNDEPETWKPSKKALQPVVKQSELIAFAMEKGAERSQASHWASSFAGYWADPKRKWMRDGRMIDWKVEFSKQIAKWRT